MSLNQEENSQEDDVRSVENTISLYRANKINNLNVWSCELIDKLETLVMHHNAYVRNFRNIGDSLDATMKVYAIRVDSVWIDVRRLGYGVASTESSQNARRLRSKGQRGDLENDDCCEMNGSAKKPRKTKQRRTTNIFTNKQQMNAPLSYVFIPDNFSYKMNLLSGDMGASTRLFLSILPVKNSFLNINTNEPYIDDFIYENMQYRDDYMYYNPDQDILMSVTAFAKLEYLPIRQNGSGLAGYRIQNTPIDEDVNDENDLMDVEPRNDFQPEYQFDDNVESFWINSMSQDLNNNLNDNLNDNLNEPIIDTAVEEPIGGEDFSFDEISKGEYSYQACANIPNYWAGPSYWKHPRNSHRSKQNNQDSSRPMPRRRRIKNIKPIFTETNDDNGTTSENDDFLKATSNVLKKIRHCDYRRWAPEKLKLPSQYDIPRTFFDSFKFCPAIDICKPRDIQEITQMNIPVDDENDFQPNPDIPPDELNGDEFFHFEPDAPVNISENFEDPPQLVEKIPILFEKRAKVINIGRLNKATLQSIDIQLTTSSLNESICNISTQEELEPGRALYSRVYKDLLKKKGKFMRNESELTPSLVLFSILNAVNKERLCISNRPNNENDFEIAQLKKI